MTNWLFTFLVVMITPVAIENIAWKTYIVWACTNFVFIFVVYFLCALLFTLLAAISADSGFPDVETTGQSLEDIDLMFENNNSIVIGPTSANLAREIRQRRNVQSAEEFEEKMAEPIDIEHRE